MSRLKSKSYSKVIKGEIHNVLSVMRADPRYASALRFSAELLPDYYRHIRTNGSGEDSGTQTQQLAQHPLIQSLRELNDRLSFLELSHASSPPALPSSHQQMLQELNVLTYISPFCTAVSSREISAPITGAALSALTKFLLYGFITPHSKGAKEGITVVARCIRHCTFEESASHARRDSSSATGALSAQSSFSKLSSTNRNAAHSSIAYSYSKHRHNDDEEVVLKLLSLASLILRSSAGRHFLEPSDVVGIFDTCLHVTHRAHTASALLRSAAGDALGHVVLVVFSGGLRCDWHDHDDTDEEAENHAMQMKEPLSDDDDQFVCQEEGGVLQDGHAHPAAVTEPEEEKSSVEDRKQCRRYSNDSAKLCTAATGLTLMEAENSMALSGTTGAGKHLPVSQLTSQQYITTTDAAVVDNYAVQSQADRISETQLPIEDEEIERIKRRAISPSKSTTPRTQSNQDPQAPQTISSVASTLRMPEQEPAIVTIMSRLATLLNPLTNNGHTCVLALTLFNIALETSDVDYDVKDSNSMDTKKDELSFPSHHLTRYPKLMSIVQHTVCKHLLQLSTTSDLLALSLTLRVIFNLFNSIKDHLKVQLEVFLTSVHLRILDPHNTSLFTPAQREVALESLLEFCQEPALMQDLYMNYDCDVACTNLFETICRTLARVASPGFLGTTVLGKGGIGTGVGRSVSVHEGYQRMANGNSSCIDKDSSVSSLSLNSTFTPGDSSNARRKSLNHCVQPGSNNASSLLQQEQPLNALNKLACEGILAVIDSIARRCQVRNPDKTGVSNSSPFSTSSFSTSPLHFVDASDTESELGSTPPSSANYDGHANDAYGKEKSLERIYHERNSKAEILMERKRKKHRLALAATEFNKRPLGREWVQAAQDLDILPSPTAPPCSIANFLYSTPKLDKTQIGLYLSKGPREKYPYHAQVLEEFVALFDFSGMNFSEALRAFLLRFRLPGEAQCIDRLMEAFAARLFEQQKGETNGEGYAVTNDMLAPMTGKTSIDDYDAEEDDETRKDDDSSTAATFVETTDELRRQLRGISFFRSADAVFVLAFSIIMLNTDLHNPTIKDERRMTVDQFIRNNRGINDGHDLPPEYLTDLYRQIKENEIQVQRDLSDVMGDESGQMHQWDGLFSKSNEVATAFFTPYDAARRTFFQAGVHERDMFTSIAPWAIQSISTIFTRSWDDALVVKALKGFKQMAVICVYFNMESMFNEILEILLSYGRDYITSTVSLACSGYSVFGSAESNGEACYEDSLENSYREDLDKYDTNSYADELSPVPHALLASNRIHSGQAGDQGGFYSSQFTGSDMMAGSAAHRGLLSLDCALMIVRNQAGTIREAWPSLIECIFALRDANALPAGLSDLDDFADSRGNVLMPSPFAVRSQRRAHKYILSIASDDEVKTGGFWGTFASIFTKGGTPKEQTFEDPDDEFSLFEDDNATNLHVQYVGLNPNTVTSSFSEELLAVAKAAQIDQLLVGMKDRVLCTKILRALLNATDASLPGTLHNSDLSPLSDELIFEHHAVFALELAARSLLSNRERAVDIYPMFLSKFELVLSFPSDRSNGTLKNPYLMERVVVTILRSCIHLYDIPDIRPYLKTSLLLLLDMPVGFLRHVSGRLACGMAIILRGSHLHLEAADEWNLIADLLDRSAKFPAGRGFVFDGIASCIDDSLPSAPYPQGVSTDSEQEFKVDIADAPFTYEGALVFARLLLKFVFGSYEGDLSMCVPAMFCLEKIYWYLFNLAADSSAIDENNARMGQTVPDEDLWRSVCSAFYSVCLSKNVDMAMQGVQCLQRFLLSTKISAVSDAGWLSVLETMTAKQPSVLMEIPRIKITSLLGKMLLIVMPELCQREENWDPLHDVVVHTAHYVGENLCAGRRGCVRPLFESTVETMTNITNVMSMPEFAHGSEFSQWASETLFAELEKVGAVGGSAQMVAARTKRTVQRDANDNVAWI